MLEEADIGAKQVEFDSRFGRGGAVDLYFAPGRVNLIGEHTDYNSGLVLPVATSQGTYLLIRGSELPPSRLYSENQKSEARFHPAHIDKGGDWADYVRGVFLYTQEGCPDLPPFDGLYFGDLPLGAGLSSSASIELVTALGMSSLGCDVDRDLAVKIGRKAENEFVGVNCGIMDQFTVAYALEGHALLLDCGTIEFRHIPFNLEGVALVIGHTGVFRSLADSEYNVRKRECEQALEALSSKLGRKRSLSEITIMDFERARWSIPELLAKRAEHVIFENGRVEEAAHALERGDAERLGYLMNRSHESLRDLFEASSPELDAMQEITLRQPGVYGCRMTGAGFGGCVITLIKEEAVESYLRKVSGPYWEATHYEPEFIVTSPSGGARKLTKD